MYNNIFHKNKLTLFSENKNYSLLNIQQIVNKYIKSYILYYKTMFIAKGKT